MNEAKQLTLVLTKEEARHILQYMTYRADEVMVGDGLRFVDGLKVAGAGFFAGVPVKFSCGCHSAEKGVCANDCINEL